MHGQNQVRPHHLFPAEAEAQSWEKDDFSYAKRCEYIEEQKRKQRDEKEKEA